MLWHARCGLALLGLLELSAGLGLIGPTYARFGQFGPPPANFRATSQGRWQGLGHIRLAALSGVCRLIGYLGHFRPSAGWWPERRHLPSAGRLAPPGARVRLSSETGRSASAGMKS